MICFRIEMQREMFFYLPFMVLKYWKSADLSIVFPAIGCHLLLRSTFSVTVSGKMQVCSTALSPALLEQLPKAGQHWGKLIKLEVVFSMSNLEHLRQSPRNGWIWSAGWVTSFQEDKFLLSGWCVSCLGWVLQGAIYLWSQWINSLTGRL